MGSGEEKSPEAKNEYAVVTYIEHGLGDFLNELRRGLVADCRALAHVTVLPPRPLAISPEEACELIDTQTRREPRFTITLAGIEIFEQTEVIYAEIGKGRGCLLDLHFHLNVEGLNALEMYPYHPHVTLAQMFPAESMPAMVDYARRKWAEYPGERTFPVDRVTFVQNTNKNLWIDLATFELRGE